MLKAELKTELQFDTGGVNCFVLNKHGPIPRVVQALRQCLQVDAMLLSTSPGALSCCYYTSLQPLLSCVFVIVHAYTSFRPPFIPWYVSVLRSVTLDLLWSLMLVLLRGT